VIGRRLQFSVMLLSIGMGACKTPQKDEVMPPAECENTFPPSEYSVLGEESEEDDVALPPESVFPDKLSDSILYTDIRGKTVHEAVVPFTPQYPLWSDGAGKKRWVYLPECTPVDTSDMNVWRFPVGTRFFKEFSIDGKRIETRVIERIGEGSRDFAYGSYLWNEDESEATLVSSEGLNNAKETSHDIPSKADCLRCHGSAPRGGGIPSRGLGFSAQQLNYEGDGLTLQQLVVSDKLTDPPAAAFSVPGSSTEKAALGYLHANCGSCHNASSDGLPQVDLNLWLDVETDSVEETGAWQTAVGKPTALFSDQHVNGRVVAGQPAQSAIWYRMSQRGNNAQMPPIGTEKLDESGLEIIFQWIEALP
jgi:hypothetical protein